MSELEVTPAGNETFDVPSHATIENSQGILSTALAPGGRRIVSRAPGDNDVVRVGGVSMELKTALQHGLVGRSADGTYHDLPTAKVDAAVKRLSASPKAPEPDHSHALDCDFRTLQTMGNLADTLRRGGQNDSAFFASLFSDSKVENERLARAAEQTGEDEIELRKRTESVRKGVKEAIFSHLADRKGILSAEHEDAFWQWVDKTHKSDLPGALSAALYGGDARQFELMAEQFVIGHGRGIGKARNIKTIDVPKSHRDDPGYIDVVEIDGRKMTLAAARREGLV